MSYIGSNPSADDIRLSGTAGIRSAALLQLTVSATDPGTPAEGMVYYNDGSGTISEGLKVYKNGNFVSLDAQEGDADTLQLKQAKDIPSVAFSAAVSSTNVVGNTFPVPKTTSTGTIVGTFSVPTTGTDALMSNVDASRVFKYISSSTVDSESDYFGIPLAIPKAFRGENISLSFVYRTVTTSTTALADGSFKVYVQDKTNAVIALVDSATGSQVAGTTIALSTGTASTMAVGDKVFVETGGGVAGAAGNDITEAYLTSVSGDNIKLSATVLLPSTAGGTIISKWLTDLTGGSLAAAASTTGAGVVKKLQFTPFADTAEIYLWFQNTVSTGSTKIDTLFFDQVLISSNKYLQVESQIKNEVYNVLGAQNATATAWGSTNDTCIPWASTGEVYNTTGNLVSITSSTADGWALTANKECIVEGFFRYSADGTGENTGWTLNATGTDLDTVINSIAASKQISIARIATAAPTNAPITIRLSVGDVVRAQAGNVPSTYGSLTEWRMSLNIKPVDQEKVIIESEDEIFTDWTAWTIAPEGFGTVTDKKAFYRRVGDTMEIKGAFVSGTPSSTVDAAIPLPSGYAIDSGRVGDTNMWQFGQFSRVGGANLYVADQHLGWVFYNDGSSTKLYLAQTSTGDANIGIKKGDTIAASSGQEIIFNAVIPIVGWKAKFTPLLSMPLVDFGSYSNIYSAKISASATLTSESESFITSVSNSTTGVCVVTFKSGHFSQTPAVTAAGDTNSTTNEVIVSIDALSSTAATIRTSLDNGVESDEDFWLMFMRQGADFKQPPQPTAAIIKPSVAFVKEVQDSTTGGGVTGTANAWHDRTLNTIEGESWFINSLTSNTVTVQPGQYEIESVQMLSQVDSWTSRLYNTTDSVLLAPASSNKASAGAYYANSHAKWVGTFTVATGIKLQYIVETASTGGDALGVSAAAGHAAANMNSIYSQVKITKLK